MAEFVLIRHESQPEDTEGARTLREAFDSYYKAKGWVIAGDAPAVTTENDPSPTLAEQVRLLDSDPDKLAEALAPSPSPEDAAKVDADVTSSKRGGNKS